MAPMFTCDRSPQGPKKGSRIFEEACGHGSQVRLLVTVAPRIYKNDS
jgi:hypothetical protein